MEPKQSDKPCRRTRQVGEWPRLSGMMTLQSGLPFGILDSVLGGSLARQPCTQPRLGSGVTPSDVSESCSVSSQRYTPYGSRSHSATRSRPTPIHCSAGPLARVPNLCLRIVPSRCSVPTALPPRSCWSKHLNLIQMPGARLAPQLPHAFAPGRSK